MPRNFRKKSNLKDLRQDVKELQKASAANKGIKDTERALSVSSSTAWLHTCFDTAQGTDLSNREGMSIIGRSVNIRGMLTREDSDQNIIRLLAVQFESYEDAAADAVLQYVAGSLSDQRVALYSPYKVNGDCKYRILLDKTWSLPNIITEKVFNESFRVPKSHNVMKYTQDLTQVALTNVIVFYAVSDSAAILHPTIHCTIRERFDK